MNKMNKGFVYLVGAGPGDPKLITIKGLECIKKADCIVYDRLVNSQILAYAQSSTELIYAGKSPGCHTFKQREINTILVKKALEGKIVTRLKGGDPFVFGRGGEEIEKLLEYGIPYEVVPGITAGIAVPAYAGIPVTHRKYSSTLAFITGNEDTNKEDSSIDWSKLATGVGTLVFYMGMRNLAMIVKKLIANGRSPKTPIALIRWGTKPEQETLVATLNTVVKKAEEVQFRNPAIIIVGEVVKLRDKMIWFEQKPLFGKRIVVTRSRDQASTLAEAIENLGGESWEFPIIDIQDPDDFTPMDAAIANLRNYQWLIFTSVNGVKKFFQRLYHYQKDARALFGVKLCTIGPKTKEVLKAKGLICDYVPEEYRTEAIIEWLKTQNMKGKKVLLVRANTARRLLSDALENLGAVVTNVVAYKTVMGTANIEQLRRMLKDGMIHIITFTSSTTVENFIKMLGLENYKELLQGVMIASIGPITSGTIRNFGLKVDVEAAEYTINGLIKAIKDKILLKG